MNHLDPTPYSLTPAGQVLARCVASGVLAQRDLDAVQKVRDADVFSSRLAEAEQVADLKTQLDVKNLELELMKLEKESEDVTHSFFLSQRFAALQQFTSHLQEVLKKQASLRQRLMKPVSHQSLPIEANLHRYVVELIAMAMELIENMESKVEIIGSFPSLGSTVTSLDNAVAQLLTQVAEVEELSAQVFQWKDLQHQMFTSHKQTST